MRKQQEKDGRKEDETKEKHGGKTMRERFIESSAGGLEFRPALSAAFQTI